MTTIVVDLGTANLRSICMALESCGAKVRVSEESRDLYLATNVILPGVGSFPAVRDRMRTAEIDKAICELWGSTHTRVLGVCLGFQLLCETSTEGRGDEGLGLFPLALDSFLAEESPVSVPHVGFKRVHFPASSILGSGDATGKHFYFVHSYRARPTKTSDDRVATATHGAPFVAAYESGNFFGTQFHPEKSHRAGLALLRNFLTGQRA